MGYREIRSVEIKPFKKWGSYFYGICPWDGSTHHHRRSGHQERHCDTCGATFNEPCPGCKQGQIQKSLGRNPETGEYGCDMCGRLFIYE